VKIPFFSGLAVIVVVVDVEGRMRDGGGAGDDLCSDIASHGNRR
jgi:hypothetical protein